MARGRTPNMRERMDRVGINYSGIVIARHDEGGAAVAAEDVRPVTGIMLNVAELLPAAADVFDADELEQRIAKYAAMAEAKLPLPLFGADQPAVPTSEPPPATTAKCCWACGARGVRLGSKAAGWASRWIASESVTEIYCPDCFETWGWPDEYQREIERLERNSADYNRAACERVDGDGGAKRGEPAHADSRGVRAGSAEAVSL